LKDIKDILFIVQSRLNSERVPKKMIKDFAGTTLVDLVLEKLVNIDIIPNNQIYLSANEKELIDVGNKYPINIFERSYESANIDSGIDVMFEWYNKLPFKYVVMVAGCNPLLKEETIEGFIESYIQSDYDGMFAVIDKKEYFWNKEGIMLNDWPEGQDLLNSKAVESTYQAAHCLYGSLMESIGKGKWCGSWRKKNDPVLYPINGYEAFDIDYQWQFEIAEVMYEKNNILYTE
tara:strand:- start:1207 stop:1905 length:699 start_codon:yes stop_codon:yes gene_type:complete